MPVDWVLRCSPPRAGLPRLVCFPYAGCGAATYRPWARLLPDIEVLAVQLPGRGHTLGEATYTSMDRLSLRLVEELRPWTGTGGYAFFGHSLGALMAYETARAIVAAGEAPPALLVLSSCPAPHRLADRPPVYQLPRELLVAHLRQQGGTPAAVLDDPELLDLVLPTVRADFALVDTYRYRPGPALDCPIVALHALGDPTVTADEVADWRGYGTGFKWTVVPGDHFAIDTRTEVVDVVATALSAMSVTDPSRARS